MRETVLSKPFFFDANKAHKKITSPEDWKFVIDAHEKGWNIEVTGELLMSIAHATKDTEEAENNGEEPEKGYLPNFGFYNQHCSRMTLKDWAQKNNMYEVLSLPSV